MNIGVWSLYESLSTNNFMFLNPDAPIGDGLLKPTNLLYQVGKGIGINFNTLDLCNLDELDAILFLDFPNLNNQLVIDALKSNKPKFLQINESELIRSDNFNRELHKIFYKIFTWHDGLIKENSNKYVKLSLSLDFSDYIKNEQVRDKFCAVISGNKSSQHELELYSKRVEAIKWFEKNHPDQFDLYGIGWDLYQYIGQPIIRSNQMNTALFSPIFPSYKGKVEKKLETLKKYKFSICYENAKDIPGYITEKIFDCFLAGCIPVYWGANNITDFIPKECFIDKRDFNDYEELYHYMNDMKDDIYQQYLNSIDLFIQKKSYLFSKEIYVRTIVQELLSFTRIS